MIASFLIGPDVSTAGSLLGIGAIFLCGGRASGW